MKMRDMAENYSQLASGPQSPQPYYPSFSVTKDQLPEAEDWEVGKDYEVCIKVKMTGSHLHEGRVKEKYDFKMIKIGCDESTEE